MNLRAAVPLWTGRNLSRQVFQHMMKIIFTRFPYQNALLIQYVMVWCRISFCQSIIPALSVNKKLLKTWVMFSEESNVVEKIILMQTFACSEDLVEGNNQDNAQGIFVRRAIQSWVLNFNSKGSPSQVEKALLTHVCTILGMDLLSCMPTPGFYSTACNPGTSHMKISARIKIICWFNVFSEILFLKMVVEEDGACYSVSSEFLSVPI